MSNYTRLFIDNSYIFLTIVTYDRKPILIENIELLRESIHRTQEKYKFKIFAGVVLPDHIHIILKFDNIKEYPNVIFAIKYHFSRNINTIEDLTQSKINKGEKGIWQRRYWEHTIRDEKDLKTHLDYIHYNPVKHNLVRNVKDWKFSSFHKFVEKGNYDLKWGSNVSHIKELDFE